ncbi:transporter [Vibrio methylphosphonaticus]|uniref:transporter n=1 Tax=Vibrio methylphosphonaticus TaxID=2946866 RepID=UPI00202A54B7|nr:transporter [Vibrio methylphosphonaticus]MCL9774854.1 transporter [Vibrio methylphosphonaticus]
MSSEILTEIEFDYTSFLGASCSKKWTFLEALTSVAPIFGEAWKANAKELEDVDSRLWNEALNTLSSRQSDERNLIRLIRLAREEKISRLKVVMPYSLEVEQLDEIQTKTETKVLLDTENDVLTIILSS